MYMAKCIWAVCVCGCEIQKKTLFKLSILGQSPTEEMNVPHILSFHRLNPSCLQYVLLLNVFFFLAVTGCHTLNESLLSSQAHYT